MIGQLYHSGAAPMHDIRLTVTGVGFEEANALMAEFSRLDHENRLTFEVGQDGLSATLKGCLTQGQAQAIVTVLFEARRQREAAAE